MRRSSGSAGSTNDHGLHVARGIHARVTGAAPGIPVCVGVAPGDAQSCRRGGPGRRIHAKGHTVTGIKTKIRTEPRAIQRAGSIQETLRLGQAKPTHVGTICRGGARPRFTWPASRAPPLLEAAALEDAAEDVAADEEDEDDDDEDEDDEEDELTEEDAAAEEEDAWDAEEDALAELVTAAALLLEAADVLAVAAALEPVAEDPCEEALAAAEDTELEEDAADDEDDDAVSPRFTSQLPTRHTVLGGH